MKGNKLYIIIGIAVAALIGLVLLITHSERKFRWNGVFANDDEPWGYELFDNIMSSSLDAGYEVTNLEADSLLLDTSNLDKTLLLCGYNLHTNPEATMEFVKKGGCIVVAAFQLSRKMEEAFDINVICYRDYGVHPLKDNDISLKYTKDDKYDSATYTMTNELLSSSISSGLYNNNHDSYHLKWKKNLKSVEYDTFIIYTATYGKGTIVLCAAPLLFTNYGILENNNHEMILRILSQGGNRPVVRGFLTKEKIKHRSQYDDDDYDSYTRRDGLMDYILDNPSLSAAYFMALAGLLLFCLFTARRKQRVIKVMEPRKNGQLEFIKQIGSMHFRKGSSNSIVMSKLRLLREDVRQKTGIDIGGDYSHERIAQYLGISEDESYELFRHLQRFVNEMESNPPDMSNERMMQLINIMNRIQQCLSVKKEKE